MLKTSYITNPWKNKSRHIPDNKVSGCWLDEVVRTDRDWDCNEFTRAWRVLSLGDVDVEADAPGLKEYLSL